MTSFETGRRAEAAAAVYLRRQGYRVLQQNWRTRYCEIDIVARKANTIQFVEVKYRANKAQGSGLDYITPVKLRQMAFAAQVWVSEKCWTGDYGLAAVAVTGHEFIINDFILL